MKVLIKYCGGCNSAFDRVALVKEIIHHLTAEFPDCQVVYQGSADWGIMISGCEVCCLDQENERQGVPNWIIIGPDLVNYLPVPLRDIPLKIVDLIKKKAA